MFRELSGSSCRSPIHGTPMNIPPFVRTQCCKRVSKLQNQIIFQSHNMLYRSRWYPRLDHAISVCGWGVGWAPDSLKAQVRLRHLLHSESGFLDKNLQRGPVLVSDIRFSLTCWLLRHTHQPSFWRHLWDLQPCGAPSTVAKQMTELSRKMREARAQQSAKHFPAKD